MFPCGVGLVEALSAFSGLAVATLAFLCSSTISRKLVDTKCCLEASHSTGWNGCDLPTVWAGQGELSLLVSNNQPDQALLAVDMVALELLWVSVGVQTDGAVELIF